MTPNDVWDILVANAGANESDRTAFLASWPRCREFRFMGWLGFGGKVWAPSGAAQRHPYVSCYAEDRNVERDRKIAYVNRRLAGERSVRDLAPEGVNPRWWAWQQTQPEYGGHLANVEYMSWIQERWTEYRKDRDLSVDFRENEAAHDDFDFWLATKIAPMLDTVK